jgi:hypothetical protein
MKSAFLILSLLFSLSSAGTGPTPATVEKPVEEDFCKLAGQVYIEDSPSFSDYQVYVQDVESFADMLVFKESVAGFATEAGHWHFTDVRAFADFTIYIETVSGFADFSIYYTSFPSAAGCQ